MSKTVEQPQDQTEQVSPPETAETSVAEATEPESEFARQAEEAPPSLIAEFVDFLKYNKKWWLTPIILVLFMLGLLVFVSGGAAAPFIYSLF